ncbi:MAG TPA: MBL fold metallo-hydrolase [Bryobacteraceae bacterium]|nr:MBL fold metallo-hydrolase [Bryobacteraceae bacterium]
MAASPIKIVVLGSGTSVGVPTIGCHCAVCTSTDPRDTRLRPSILVVHEGRNILIDTTPDFRTQALRAKLDHLDAVFFTHAHADHVMGLDDVRPFNFRQKGRIPIYAGADTMANIKRIFSYIFDDIPRATNIPQLDMRELDGSDVDVHGLKFTPVPVMHGDRAIHGFRFGSAAYLTDHSGIPDSSLDMLRGLDVLFLDALRYKPHPTHSTVDQSIRTVEKLAPRRAFFTHICHDLGHARAENLLPPHIKLAYDGLELTVEDAG